MRTGQVASEADEATNGEVGMRIDIDGYECVDRVGFAVLLGLRLNSSFDKRRQRDIAAGKPFPAEWRRIHGHPYWRLIDAEEYAATYSDRRIRTGLYVRDSKMRPAEPIAS